MPVIGTSCLCGPSGSYKDYSKLLDFFWEVQLTIGSCDRVFKMEVASIYALLELLDSHYKMLEPAEECKVKFNYVYIFIHTHQILLLTSYLKSARLLSIWLELICLMKTNISAFL